tara:strand:- start:2868 stop:3461 length:594 start_codon:yes stop_codon:yes gene_type:complete
MANWEKVVTDSQAGGNNYETIMSHKRYGSYTSSTWRGTSTTGSTATTQVWSLSTAIQAGTFPVNYSDTTMSSWVGIQFPMWMATAACEIVDWGAVAHQNTCTKGIRLGLWKGNKVTSVNTNHSGAGQGVDYVGLIDFTANADSSTIHPYTECTNLNDTAKVLQAGDMFYIFATEIPSETQTDGNYWSITNSVRIKYT